MKGRVGTAVLAALGATGVGLAAATAAISGVSPREGEPGLDIQVVASGLDIPWDLDFIDATHYLLTERPGRLWLGSTAPGSTLQRVSAPLGDLNLAKPGGLMGLVVDPGFATNRLFYTCQTHKAPNDVRVVRWRLNAAGTVASRVGAPVIAGIPFGQPHFGCRLLNAPDGALMIGTGDAGQAGAPQNRDSLAGKILRVRRSGAVPAGNPWASATTPRRFVWNYGHRNVQGLALRPGTTQIFNAEHGPDWDDEVNQVKKAANYGWNPVDPSGAPGYYQQVPMTDLVKFPKAIAAVWSSGVPTLATSGMSFVNGAAWGAYDGQAFVAQLKGSAVLTLTMDAAGAVTAVGSVPELAGTYGRLRTIRQAPDGALYILTSNGSASDVVLRVTPVAP